MRVDVEWHGSREPLPVNQYGFRYLAFTVEDIGESAATVRASSSAMA